MLDLLVSYKCLYIEIIYTREYILWDSWFIHIYINPIYHFSDVNVFVCKLETSKSQQREKNLSWENASMSSNWESFLKSLSMGEGIAHSQWCYPLTHSLEQVMWGKSVNNILPWCLHQVLPSEFCSVFEILFWFPSLMIWTMEVDTK